MGCKYLKLALLTLASVMSWASHAQTGEISVLEDTLILDKAVVRAWLAQDITDAKVSNANFKYLQPILLD